MLACLTLIKNKPGSPKNLILVKQGNLSVALSLNSKIHTGHVIFSSKNRRTESWYDVRSHSAIDPETHEYVAFHRNDQGRGFQGSRVFFGAIGFKQMLDIGTGRRVPHHQEATLTSSRYDTEQQEEKSVLIRLGFESGLLPDQLEALNRTIHTSQVQAALQVALSFIKDVSNKSNLPPVIKACKVSYFYVL